MKKNFSAVAGLCGVLVPLIGLSTIFLAVSYSPNFDWVENWISDLAGIYISPIFPSRPDVSTPTTAMILNTGLLLSGIFSFVFAVGLWKSMKIPSGRIGSLIIIIASIALFNIGLFPEPTGIPHVIASLTYFILGPIGILCIGAAAMDSGQKLLGYSMLILGIIGIIFGGPLVFFGAIPELISIITVSIFLLIFGIRMYRRAPKPIL
jgi:hypothetical membrane protein